MGAGTGKLRRVRTDSSKVESVNQIQDIKDFPEYAENFKKYPKIVALEKIPDVLQGTVEVTEKLHGANLRLLVVPEGFVVGSRRLNLTPDQGSKQFHGALEYIEKSFWLAKLRKDHPNGTVFYGEAHGQGFSRGMGYAANDLDLRLFNVRKITGEWGSAHLLDLDEEHIVPLLALKESITLDEIQELMPGSQLAGEKEGVALKNYDRLDEWGHPLWAKIVRSDFQEDLGTRKMVSPEELKARGLAQVLAEDLVTGARCVKILECANEDGKLQGQMQDMGPLMAALKTDLTEESQSDITNSVEQGMDEKFFWKLTSKHLAAWYRQRI